jgi:hypothetical protein
MRRKMMLAVVCVLVVSAILGATAQLTSAQFELELVAEVPPTAGITPEWIDGIQVLDANPNEIVFVTQNVGAYCGGGTPAAAWKLTLDPSTGQAESLELKQLLSQIQQIRGALFESCDGTLFTGGGWCLHKPPYVSTDGGEAWRAATIGVHPPNSTFSFVEYEGEIYAGTGYCPVHAQVYRWLGGPPDDWELVFDIAPPRSILSTMAVYHDRLFVGTHIYWYNGCNICQGTIPVFVSDDGMTFEPTAGIPSCHTVHTFSLLVVGDELLARTMACADGNDVYLYRWNEAVAEWDSLTPLEIKRCWGGRDFLAHEGVIYAYGQRSGDPCGIYMSTDFGLTWTLMAELSEPRATSMEMHDGIIYIGTERDASDMAYIYRLRTYVSAQVDIDPDVLNPRSGGRWVTCYIELPEGYDPVDIDVSTVMLNETVPAELHPTGIGDYDEDGTPDRMVKFSRSQVIDILPNGDQVEVRVSGEVAGGPFAGADTIRVLMPKVTYPNGGEVFEVGQEPTITWEAPAGYEPGWYDVYYTADDGQSWNMIADNVEGTSCPWIITDITSDRCLVLVEAYDAEGIMGYDLSDEFFTICSMAGVATGSAIPTQFALHPVRPNPLSQEATIRFDLPETRHVTLTVHDVHGRLVRALIDEARSANSYTVIWDGRDSSAHEVPPGIYFIRFEAGQYKAAGKIALVR